MNVNVSDSSAQASNEKASLESLLEQPKQPAMTDMRYRGGSPRQPGFPRGGHGFPVRPEGQGLPIVRDLMALIGSLVSMIGQLVGGKGFNQQAPTAAQENLPQQQGNAAQGDAKLGSTANEKIAYDGSKGQPAGKTGESHLTVEPENGFPRRDANSLVGGRMQGLPVVRELVAVINNLLRIIDQLLGKGGSTPVQPEPRPDIPNPKAPVDPAPTPGVDDDHCDPAPIDEPPVKDPVCDKPKPPVCGKPKAPEPDPVDDCNVDIADNEDPTIQNLFSRILRPDANGQLSEGQIMHGTVVALLREEGNGLAQLYRAQYRKLRKQGLSPQQAVHGAMATLVKAGKIDRPAARQLLGVAHRAAQVDDNHARISKKATASVEDAARIVAENLQAIRNGEIEAPRIRLQGKYALDELRQPRNVQQNGAVEGQGFSQGFLWKPSSESDGRLVILLPSSMRGRVASVEIHSSLPPSNDSLVERGNFAGDTHNGARPHFRFGKRGSNYPNGVYVVARMNDGSLHTQQVSQTAARLEKR